MKLSGELGRNYESENDNTNTTKSEWKDLIFGEFYVLKE